MIRKCLILATICWLFVPGIRANHGQDGIVSWHHLNGQQIAFSDREEIVKLPKASLPLTVMAPNADKELNHAAHFGKESGRAFGSGSKNGLPHGLDSGPTCKPAHGFGFVHGHGSGYGIKSCTATGARPRLVEYIPGDDQNPKQRPSGWWARSYLIDYTLIAAGTAGYLIGEDLEPRSRSRIGPSYDPDNLLELFRSDKLNERYLEENIEETVPEYWIHRFIAGGAILLAGLEAREWRGGLGSGHQFHDTIIGYAETVAVTATVTSMSKPFFARLRPDFTERALRFHCPELTSTEFDAYCKGYRDRPLSDDPEENRELLEDGQKSFISGHSSHSFNLFGYAALAIGGRYVWGAGSTSRSRPAGLAAQIALMSIATYVSVSRITDGRHHLSDVLVGAAVGTGIAKFSYWSRFDREGNPRLRTGRYADNNQENRFRDQAHVTVDPWIRPHEQGGGLRLNVSF